MKKQKTRRLIALIGAIMLLLISTMAVIPASAVWSDDNPQKVLTLTDLGSVDYTGENATLLYLSDGEVELIGYDNVSGEHVTRTLYGTVHLRLYNNENGGIIRIFLREDGYTDPNVTLERIGEDWCINGYAYYYATLCVRFFEVDVVRVDPILLTKYCNLPQFLTQEQHEIYLIGVSVYENSFDIGYSEGYNAGEDEGYNYGYNGGYMNGFIEGNSVGATEGYNLGYDVGYSEGENAGYNNGWTQGNNDGYQSGKEDGYNNGVLVGEQRGRSDALNGTHTFKEIIVAIFEAPVDLINGILDFDLLGINMASLVKVLLTLAITAVIVVILLKIIL